MCRFRWFRVSRDIFTTNLLDLKSKLHHIENHIKVCCWKILEILVQQSTNQHIFQFPKNPPVGSTITGLKLVRYRVSIVSFFDQLGRPYTHDIYWQKLSPTTNQNIISQQHSDYESKLSRTHVIADANHKLWWFFTIIIGFLWPYLYIVQWRRKKIVTGENPTWEHRRVDLSPCVLSSW